MLRFKQFDVTGPELEVAVNAWLSETEPDVKHMVQSGAAPAAMIAFLYEESFMGQELRYAQETGLTGALEPVVSNDQFPDRPVQVTIEP